MSVIRAAKPSLIARLGLVLLGTLLVLVLLEVGLRLAPRLLASLRAGARGRFTILCVGDSHTYGLHVLPPFSYPAQLQALLDPTGEEIGVLNYGVPGRNSGTLLSELPRYLEETRPDLVLVEVGYNDSWNFDAGASVTGGSGLLANLRVVRMARLLLLRGAGRGAPRAPDLIERHGKMIVVENGQERPAAIGGAALLSGDALRRQVAANLGNLVRRVRRAGAVPVILTYATENQQFFLDVNAGARASARELAVPLVELDVPFREHIAASGYTALFFEDDHPNALGNELIAGLVRDFLINEKLVVPPDHKIAFADNTPASLVITGRDDEAISFRVRGTPGRDFQIVLSPRASPPIQFFGRQIPLGEDPLIARCLQSPNLRGRTDAAGEAAARLGLEFLTEHQGNDVLAVVAVFPLAVSAAAPPVVSEPVVFRP